MMLSPVSDAEGVKDVSPGQRPGARCETMPQSLAKNTVHLIFSTKERRPWLKEALRPRMFAYLAGIFQEWDSTAMVIGGYEDHVHALFLLSKNHPLKKVVEEAKKGSSKWVKTLDGKLVQFAWQNGYGAFSVSESNVPEVKQ
jgi:REP-associated tyrosine transposase